jgi:hypothetical protein
VPAVDVDDVEAGVPRAPRGLDPVRLDAADVVPFHLLRRDERVVVARELRRGDGRHAGVARARVRAAVRELDARERPVRVGFVAHDRQVAQVVVVPDASRNDGPEVRVDADERFLGAHGSPAALGLHGAKAGLRGRLLASEPGAMRHAIEAVLERLRADPDRLEEDIVAGIARHRRG